MTMDSYHTMWKGIRRCDQGLWTTKGAPSPKGVWMEASWKR